MLNVISSDLKLCCNNSKQNTATAAALDGVVIKDTVVSGRF